MAGFDKDAGGQGAATVVPAAPVGVAQGGDHGPDGDDGEEEQRRGFVDPVEGFHRATPFHGKARRVRSCGKPS